MSGFSPFETLRDWAGQYVPGKLWSSRHKSPKSSRRVTQSLFCFATRYLIGHPAGTLGASESLASKGVRNAIVFIPSRDRGGHVRRATGVWLRRRAELQPHECAPSFKSQPNTHSYSFSYSNPEPNTSSYRFSNSQSYSYANTNSAAYSCGGSRIPGGA